MLRRFKAEDAGIKKFLKFKPRVIRSEEEQERDQLAREASAAQREARKEANREVAVSILREWDKECRHYGETLGIPHYWKKSFRNAKCAARVFLSIRDSRYRKR